MELLYIAIAVIVILAICYICILNKLNKASIKVNEALSGIDVALTKRHDVIESMVRLLRDMLSTKKKLCLPLSRFVRICHYPKKLRLIKLWIKI